MMNCKKYVQGLSVGEANRMTQTVVKALNTGQCEAGTLAQRGAMSRDTILQLSISDIERHISAAATSSLFYFQLGSGEIELTTKL